MKHPKHQIVLLSLLIGILALAAKCDDDGEDGDGDEGKPTPGSATGCDHDPPEGMGDCTEDDMATYNDCLFETCTKEYENCLGENYMARDYSGGTCEKLQNCVDDCGCDQDCVEECSIKQTTPACLGCLAALSFCGLPCMEDMECVKQD